MKTLTMLAILAIVAALGIASASFSTIPVSAAGNHCHSSKGSDGCNPGTVLAIPFIQGGFVCNKNQCHNLPNN